MRQTFHSIDVAKLVAALFVVAIHAEPFPGLAQDVLVDVLARVAVPFFFLVSSFFFFRRCPDAAALRHYVGRLGVLYLFWFVAELPITVLHAFVERNGTFLENLIVFLRNFVFSSTFSGSWFVMALMESVPLVWWLSRRLSERCLLLLSMVCFVFVVAQTSYCGFLPPWAQAWAAAVRHWVGPVELSFLSAFCYVVVGNMLARREQCLTVSSAWCRGGWLVACLVAAVAEVLAVKLHGGAVCHDTYFLLLPLTVLAFCFVVAHEVGWSADYLRLRNYSTLFYFSHFIFVFILVLVNKHVVAVPPLLKYAVVLACCLLLSVAVRRLSSRRGFRWLSYAY